MHQFLYVEWLGSCRSFFWPSGKRVHLTHMVHSHGEISLITVVLLQFTASNTALLIIIINYCTLSRICDIIESINSSLNQLSHKKLGCHFKNILAGFNLVFLSQEKHEIACFLMGLITKCFCLHILCHKYKQMTVSICYKQFIRQVLLDWYVRYTYSQCLC